MPDRRHSLPVLLEQIRECRQCEAALPNPPRPVMRASAESRVVIVGQAPGAKVHASGVPWQDDSGDHLREWLDVTEEEFRDPDNFAILPMGFCFPGRKKGGDLPPRPECAPLWHSQVLDALPEDKVFLLVGRYAVEHYLASRKRTLTDTVRAFQSYLPKFLPVPHPSWRSKLWMKKNPWFAEQLLPTLRELVRARLNAPGS